MGSCNARVCLLDLASELVARSPPFLAGAVPLLAGALHAETKALDLWDAEFHKRTQTRFGFVVRFDAPDVLRLLAQQEDRPVDGLAC